MIIYPFSRLFLGSLIRLYLGKIEGVENLPKNIPYIIAANHTSYIDDFILPYCVLSKTNRRFSFFVNSRFYKNVFFSIFLNHFKCIKVDVSKDVNNEKMKKITNENAYLMAKKRLSQNFIFMIFPEGGRSEDGKLKMAKTGVAKIALENMVPVIPVGICGSYEIMPKGAKMPRLKKASIYFGQPLYFDSFKGKEKDFKTQELVTRKIMKEIAKLTSQEYRY